VELAAGLLLVPTLGHVPALHNTIVEAESDIAVWVGVDTDV